MRNFLLALLGTTALCYGAITQAQTQPSAIPMEIREPMMPGAENKMPLEDRFTQCLKSESCSTQARMQIIQEENDEMNMYFQKLHQGCADANFKNCVDSQKEHVQKWHEANNHMRQMMKSMETQPLEAREPAAGEAEECSEEKRGLWDRIWNRNEK